MDEIVVQYRGIAGELVEGDVVVVESCGAGVLRLRRELPVIHTAEPVETDGAKGDVDADS